MHASASDHVGLLGGVCMEGHNLTSQSGYQNIYWLCAKRFSPFGVSDLRGIGATPPRNGRLGGRSGGMTQSHST